VFFKLPGSRMLGFPCNAFLSEANLIIKNMIASGIHLPLVYLSFMHSLLQLKQGFGILTIQTH